MLSLKDPRWKDFEGGYRTPYDASIPLSRLEQGESPEPIWTELWDNLYHQDDVGIASYAAVPHVARIIQQRGLFDWNAFALVVAIELVRDDGNNPALPDWLEDEYNQALREMAGFGSRNIDSPWNNELLRSVLSLIAIVKGNKDLGELILEVGPGDEKQLLEQYFEM